MRARLKQLVRGGVDAALRRRGHSPAMRRAAARELAWWKSARVEAMRRRRPLVEGRAVVWAEAGRAELTPVEVPLATRAEVTILTGASVVSPGTERAYYLRLPDARPTFPYFPGYSLAGTAVDVGPGVAHVNEGDAVAAIRVRHASVATVRADRVFRVPDGVEVADAAFVYLGVISGAAVTRAALAEGEPVCIVGGGTIGLLCQRLASVAGAGPATVVARSSRREAAALAGGASFALAKAAGEDVAPLVFDASGDPSGLALAARLASPGGRIILVGSPRGSGEVPLEELGRKRLRVIGTHVENLSLLSQRSGRDLYAEEAQRFLEALRSDAVAVADLADEVADPREADAFYRRLARGELAGARFDWTLLERSDRMRPSRMLRTPRLAARGVDFRRSPLHAGRRSSRAVAADPFAGAEGMLGVALLGCGDIGVDNAAAVAAAPNARLVACHDPEPPLAEAVAQRFGATAVPSTEALLGRADVQAVFISVPHHLHAPLAIQAAEAGRHVIVEKPLARTLDEAQELAAGVRRAAVTATVCFPQRFEPHVEHARRLVSEGALGEVTGALVVYFADKAASYWVGGYSGRSVSGWRGSRALAGGGVLMMNLPHLIDLVRAVAQIEAVEVSAVTAASEGLEVEDHVSVSVRYGNGAVGTFAGSSAARGATDEQVQLWGTEGHLVLSPEPRLYTLRAGAGVAPSRWHSIAAEGTADPRAIFVSRFATALARGEAPDVALEDGLAVQAVVEAAYRADETKRAVNVADLLDVRADA
jgi:predicted dehydrogenase/NADPH:quinone reductase-like Zn-dependent oxidoreductase